MAKKFFFHDLTISNFRLFKELKIEKFKRINIIGGFNGVGKSALLETIFFLLDLRNPICLVRPLSFRGAQISGEEGVSCFFQDNKKLAEIKFNSSVSRGSIIIERATLPSGALSAISANVIGGAAVRGSSLSADDGIRIHSGAGAGDFDAYIMPHGDGFAATITNLGTMHLPTCQLLSMTLRVSSGELAEWLSDCIKSDRLKAVIEHLKILDPSIEDLVILYNGPNPTVYARRKEGVIPVELLGDGFRNLLSAILSIFRMKNGIVLLDEVDTALHYSVTSKFWEIIAQAADEANCQIFATSHSREAILSAAQGINRAGRAQDFGYFRLEKNNSHHDAIAYSFEDIEIASAHGFEFR